MPSGLGSFGVAKHVRRRRRNSSGAPVSFDAQAGADGISAIEEPSDPPTPEAGSSGAESSDGSFGSGSSPDADWFGPSSLDDEAYAARRDVSLASMLMLGSDPYQRIDGMGLARKALEAAVTGDSRLDLSEDERLMLANARAWCMLVHGDLGHRSRLDDPFVLADAERYVAIARGLAPGSPHVDTTAALFELRKGRTREALENAQRAIVVLGSLPDHQRSGRTQGDATLAVLTLALVTVEWGDVDGAQALAAVARAVRSPVDVDDVAFAALMTQLEQALTRRA